MKTLREFIVMGILLGFGLFGSATVVAQTPAFVVGNTQLASLVTSNYTAAVRLGFATAGDADPLTYFWSSGSCSPGADGGSEVTGTTATGGCWYAHFPATGADVREWGPLTTATNINSALAWAAGKCTLNTVSTSAAPEQYQSELPLGARGPPGQSNLL